MLVVDTVRAEMGNITDHCTGHYIALYSTEKALHSTENALYCTENVLWVQGSVGSGEPPSSWTIPWCRYLCTYNMLHSLNCIALKMYWTALHLKCTATQCTLSGVWGASRWLDNTLLSGTFRPSESLAPWYIHLLHFSSESPLPRHTRTSCILKDLFL